MERRPYILDTNVLSDALNGHPVVMGHIRTHANARIYMCQPVYYEAQRGLLWRQAPTKLRALESLRDAFAWIELRDADWFRAAQLWAESQKQGRQFSDVDLLIAALALRLDAVVVSSDADFDVLPVSRQDWRTPIA